LVAVNLSDVIAVFTLGKSAIEDEKITDSSSSLYQQQTFSGLSKGRIFFNPLKNLTESSILFS
jgi:hypothetical protein